MKLIYIILILSLCIGCNKNDFITAEPSIVVEGWIDDEGFPVVILTSTLVVDKKYQDLENIVDNVLRWATVKVSDGEEEVFLTGKTDRSYFPPYIYTTGKMRGKKGKTYKLTVSHGDFYAEAETTIPEPVMIESISVEKCADSDTLYEIKAKFPFSEDTRYYKLFTKPFDESEAYLSSFMGILNTENLNEEMMYPVYRGKNIFNKDDYTPFFKIDETVLIKCANLNYDNYLFWKEFNDIIQLSTIPLFPASKNIYSNINGGLGYWTGYGSAEYLVNIREMVEN